MKSIKYFCLIMQEFFFCCLLLCRLLLCGLLLCGLLLCRASQGGEVFLNQGGGADDGHTLWDTVVTELGNAYTLQLPKTQGKEPPILFRNWSKGNSSGATIVTGAETLPEGMRFSNLVALNTGTDTEVVVVFGFKPELGYRLYRINIVGDSGTVSSHSIQAPSEVRESCLQPNNLSLSAGFRETIAFASDCLIGEFSYAGDPAVVWEEVNFHHIYASIPPAINSQGTAHFVVRKGAGQLIHIYRASKGSIDISNFVGLPPEANTPLLEASVNGMVVLADDSLLLSGNRGYLQVKGTAIRQLSNPAGLPWGAGNIVSTEEAFYLPRRQGDKLHLERVTLAGVGRSFSVPQTLSIFEQQMPGSINLVYDEDQLQLTYYAKGHFLKHMSNSFEEAPNQDDLILSAVAAEDQIISTQRLSFPVSLLQAGANTYIKGFINTRIESLFSLTIPNSISSPYRRNLRGFWSQPKADEQQTSSVPGGVEFLLDVPAILDVPAKRVALSCYSIDNPDVINLIPSSGVLLHGSSKRLSLYHQELTQNSLFDQPGKGAYCQPVSWESQLSADCDELILPSNESSSGTGLCTSNIVAIETLGDKVLLGRVGDSDIPLWVVEHEQINIAISSDKARTTTACLNRETQCNGYRRLAIGGNSEQMGENESSINIPAVATLATIGAVFLVVVVAGWCVLKFTKSSGSYREKRLD